MLYPIPHVLANGDPAGATKCQAIASSGWKTQRYDNMMPKIKSTGPNEEGENRKGGQSSIIIYHNYIIKFQNKNLTEITESSTIMASMGNHRGGDPDST